MPHPICGQPDWTQPYALWVWYCSLIPKPCPGLHCLQ